MGSPLASEPAGFLITFSAFEIKASSVLVSQFCMIGADDELGMVYQLHSDERGVVGRYEMSLSRQRWTLTRHAFGFSQRFIGRFNTTRRVIHWSLEEVSRWTPLGARFHARLH